MDKSKKQIMVILFLLIASKIFASFEVGISGGIDNNYLLTNSSFYYEHQYFSDNGFYISIPFQYNIKDSFALRTEINYVSKNYLHKTYQKLIAQNTEEYCSNGFLEIPLIFQISTDPFDSGVNWFVNIGPYIDIWLFKHHKGTTFDLYESEYYLEGHPNRISLPTFNNSLSILKYIDNSLQIGLLLGTGFDFKISDKIKLFSEVRYLYSFNGLTNKDSQKNLYNKYNRTIVCQIGAMYSF